MLEFAFPQLPALLNAMMRLCIGLAVPFAVFVPLERMFALHRQRVFRQELVTDVGYCFVNGLLIGVVLTAPLGLVAWAADRYLPVDFRVTVAASPIWVRAALVLVVGELGYYWSHRLSHEIPFLWRFHAVHHSAPIMDFLVNNRVHPVDMIFTRLFTLAPIYVLGIANPFSASSNVFAMLVLAISTNWSYLIHANVRWRLGRLEWLITSPAFHHWHHTRSGAVNHNYSTLLPWMDRIFGTHYLPKVWPDAYGITTEMPGTLPEQLVHPFLSQTSGLGATRADGNKQH